MNVTPTPINIPKPADRRNLVDECAHLAEELGPKRKRYDQLRAQLESWTPRLAKSATATAREEGNEYIIVIGERTNETKVTCISMLYKLLGVAAFLRFVEACRPTQKALDGALADPKSKSPVDPTMRTQFLSTAQTGGRRLDVTRKFGGKDAA